MSKEINFSHKISELSDFDASNDVVNDDSASSDQDFINDLRNSMNNAVLMRPNQNYAVRSKAYLMHKYGEEQSKRNALISFVNVKEHFIDLSKILVRSTVLAPVAASIIFAFIGGYMFGNTSLDNGDVQTAQVIDVKNNLNTPISSSDPSSENQNINSLLPGIVMTADSVQPIASYNVNDITDVTTTEIQSTPSKNNSSDVDVVASVQMQSQLDALQSSLSTIAALADNNESLNSSLLHSMAGDLHAITAYIAETNNIAPTFVMQFLQTSSGLRATMASIGNDAQDLAYIATDIATQESIIGAAHYFDTNPNALAIYAASNW